jgi:hypothetical protein
MRDNFDLPDWSWLSFTEQSCGKSRGRMAGYAYIHNLWLANECLRTDDSFEWMLPFNMASRVRQYPA